MTYDEKIKKVRTARNILSKLEDRGILENNLTEEQITAIRIAEYALDELWKSKEGQLVKRGHWIEEVREIGETFRLYQTYIHCSECGKEHYSGTLPKPNFCDNCGARMDGDENDG